MQEKHYSRLPIERSHLDLELQVQLEIRLCVQLVQHLQQRHHPCVVGSKDRTSLTRLEHLSHERHHVEEFLRTLNFSFEVHSSSHAPVGLCRRLPEADLLDPSPHALSVVRVPT